MSKMSTTRKITIAVAACFGIAAIAAGVAVGANSIFGSEQTTHTRFDGSIHRIVVDGGAGDVEVSVPRGTYAVTTHTDSGDESVRGIVRYDRAAHAIHVSTNAGDVTVKGR